MLKKILQKEALVLRETAKSVPVETIKSPKIQKIIKEMKMALASQDDGVAIAAPQIGYSLRIFVISEKVEKIIKESKDKSVNIAEKNTNIKNIVRPTMAFINPVIKKMSKEKNSLEEGCLSVRYLYGKVNRSVKASVEAYDEQGKKFTRGGTGLLAQIFQHEVDHLNGVLFIDKAKHIEEVLPDHVNHSIKNAKK